MGLFCLFLFLKIKIDFNLLYYRILKKLRRFLNYKDIMTTTQLSYVSNEYVRVRGIYLEIKFLNDLDFELLIDDECFRKAIEETRQQNNKIITFF